jgi:uncharacterized protein involved in exopolysaccharide biosynthesis/Mrp family chromosome partitioning ATPase
MELSSLFSALLRRKWIILLCTVVAAAAGFLFTMGQKNVYKSSAQLATGFTITEDLKLSNEMFNLPQIELKFNNAIENITSTRVISLVSYSLLLHDLQSPTPFSKPDNGKVKTLPGDKQQLIKVLAAHLDSVTLLSPSVPQERDALNAVSLYGYDENSLENGLKVERFQKTDYINIEYKSDNPDLSAFVVNTLCDEFRTFSRLNRRNRTNLSIVNLDSMLTQKKATLDMMEQEKKQYMTDQGLLDANLEGSSKLGQLATYQNELIEEKGIQQDMNYRVKELDLLIKSAKDQNVTAVADPDAGARTDNKGDYIRLRRDYHDLYTKYIQGGASDPVLKKQLDDISQKMTKLDVSDAGAAGGQLVSLDQMNQKKLDASAQLQSSNLKINSLEKTIADLTSSMGTMAGKSAAVQQYDRQIQIASQEYSAAKQQLENAQNMNDNAPANFRQTLVGEPALHPENSKRGMIILLCAIAALLLSAMVVLAMSFFDNSVKTSERFISLTKLPLMGNVDRVKDIQGTLQAREASAARGDNEWRDQLRKLRYEIRSSGKTVFLITSPRKGDGKTTLIKALSASLSLSGKRVLILDTNFNNNDLTLAFEAKPVLQQLGAAVNAAGGVNFASLISRTSIPGVDIIGSQSGDYTPSEILREDKLKTFMEQWKKDYDYILAEGAPLNEYSDSKELMLYIEQVIAIFSAESTLTPQDKESIEYLQQLNGKFAGSILNKTDPDNT